MDGLKKTGLVKSFKELKWYEWLMAAIMIGIAARSMILAFINPTAGGNPPWLTVVNFISAICGCFCIFFCASANISNFGFAVVNTLVYAVYLFYWKIYGTFFLEVLFYIPMNFITWRAWVKHKDTELTHKTKAKKLSVLQMFGVVVGIAALTIAVKYCLATLAGNSWLKLATSFGWNPEILAWIDAATFAIGIAATLLELGRYGEQYDWWIITDILAVAMYILHFDIVYLTKKTIYLVMAVVGKINWTKLNKERNLDNE